MNEKNTSYKNNKNKEEPKIIFEEFPYDDNGKIKRKDKKSNGIYTFAVIFVIIALFIISSILNQVVLYDKESNSYKTVNKFNGDYATIIEGNRENVFKQIGFVSIYQKKENINSKITDVTYASNKVAESISNDINVYYDEDAAVKYINLNLAYSKDKFSINKATSDCNAILNNFVKVKIKKSAITEVNKNKYYHEDTQNNISLTFKINNDIKDYYILNVIVQNESSN